MIRVLLVDDEPDLCEISQMFLSREEDISVEIALSAQEGLEILDKNSFDVIVSDYQMPRIDGIQFLEEVRKRKGKIPFILFTGKGREEIVIKALNVGADFYIQKGGNPKSQFAELTHKIRQAFQKNRSEKLLREKETQLQAILEATADGILAVDNTGRMLKASQRFAEIWRIPRSVLDQGDGRALLDYVQDQVSDPDTFLKKVQALDGSEKVDMDTILLKDGRVVERYSFPMLMDGARIGRVWSFRDVTEQKRVAEELLRKNEELRASNEQIAASEEELRANFDELTRQEQALRVSEEKFRSLVEYSLEGIAILDFEGKILFANNAAAHLVDIDHYADLIGRNVLDFIAPESREDVIHDFIQISQGSDAYRAHYQVVSAKGKKLWVESVGKVIIYEGRSADLVSLRDITEQESAEKALWERHSQMRALIDNLPFDTWAMDWTGRYVLQNPVSVLNWGDCIGKNAGQVPLPADLLEHWQQSNKKAFEGNLVRGEMSVSSGSGTRIYDEIIAPVCLGSEIKGIIGVNIDITGRKQTEEALRQANRKLSLLSGITRHDIRNQIIALRSVIHLIDRDTLDPQTRKLIDIAEKSTERINNQIEFTKEYEDLGMEETRWQDVNGLLSHVMLEFPLSGVSIHQPADNFEIFADPLLEKVFYNLIDNALRHGGKVTRISLSCQETGHGLCIAVEDNGQGIPDTDKMLIFEQNFGRNTGLGLFLARDILSITGISIAETGTYGSGARFEMNVPAGGYRHGRK